MPRISELATKSPATVTALREVIGVAADVATAQAAAQAASDSADAAAAATVFTQSGTGAVARTMQDKAREWVSPEDFKTGADNPVQWTEAIRKALTAAGTSGGIVKFNRMYDYCGEMVVPAGVSIIGSRSTGLKRIAQVTALTTSSITSGSTVKTFTVDDSTGFAVGQRVIFIMSATYVTPFAAVRNRNPIITAISGNEITIDPRGAIEAVGVGSTIATMTQGLILSGDNIVQGITIDGNEANNLYGNWYTSPEVCVEGDNCYLLGALLKDTTSDSVLVAHPTNYIYRFRSIGTDYRNIGGNAIHSGNAYDIQVIGGSGIGTNQRYASNFAEGGETGATGHQDGFYSLSNHTSDLLIQGVRIEDAIAVVGGDSVYVGATYVDNDRITVAGCQIKNVYRPLWMSLLTHDVVWDNNRVEADYPFTHAGGCVFAITGDNADNRPHRLTINGGQWKNVQATIGNAIDIRVGGGLQVDNYDLTASTPNGIAAFSVINSSGVAFGEVTIKGGQYAVYYQNNGISADRCINNTLEGAWQFIGQTKGGIVSDGNPQDLKISGGLVVSDAATAIPEYVGIALPDGATMTGTKFVTPVGLPYTGIGRRVQNAHGYVVDGVINLDVADYVSTYHTPIATANGAVASLGSNEYAITKTGGGADAWTLAAYTDTYSDEDFDLRIIPKESSALYKAFAGATQKRDPTSIVDGVQTDLDYGWIFWNGEAVVAEAGNNRTAFVAYAADDVFWVVRRSHVIKYYKGGATPEAGTLVFTSVAGADERGELRAVVSIRNENLGGAVNVRMFG